MDADLFNKALQDLAVLDYRGRIEFYIYNEPCKDMPWLLQCISTAHAVVPRACLMIATNGDYLRGAGSIMKLYDAGLNQLLINCYSPGLYEKRQEWLAQLPAEISRDGGTYSYVNPRGRENRTIAMLDKSSPEIFGKGIFRIQNRAGNIAPFMPALSEPVSRMCTKPFRLLNINWEGDALICCNDYAAAHSFGNLRDMTLTQLWNNPVINEYRRRLYNKDRSAPMCRTCDCPAGAYAWSIEKPTGPYAKGGDLL
jgi:radical SAM protein with 4Fe4S-binding SPASM domain